MVVFVEMENGNGSHAANDNGHANGHVVPLRSIRYTVHGEESHIRYSPFSRIPCCPYRTTYTYPNELVLSLDDEHLPTEPYCKKSRN